MNFRNLNQEILFKILVQQELLKIVKFIGKNYNVFQLIRLCKTIKKL